MIFFLKNTSTLILEAQLKFEYHATWEFLVCYLYGLRVFSHYLDRQIFDRNTLMNVKLGVFGLFVLICHIPNSKFIPKNIEKSKNGSIFRTKNLNNWAGARPNLRKWQNLKRLNKLGKHLDRDRAFRSFFDSRIFPSLT